MARKFKHYLVTFTRTVEQTQTVDVAVDENLSEDLGEQVAKQTAATRLKISKWQDDVYGEVALTDAVVAEEA